MNTFTVVEHGLVPKLEAFAHWGFKHRKIGVLTVALRAWACANGGVRPLCDIVRGVHAASFSVSRPAQR